MNQNIFISSDSNYNSLAYDPVKTRLLELDTEVEDQELTNHKAQNQAL